MAAGMRGDPADAVARVGRHWGWVLAFGIITLLIGIVALVWPGRTLVVVAVLFGIQLIVMGIFRFVSAFASDDGREADVQELRCVSARDRLPGDRTGRCCG